MNISLVCTLNALRGLSESLSSVSRTSTTSPPQSQPSPPLIHRTPLKDLHVPESLSMVEKLTLDADSSFNVQPNTKKTTGVFNIDADGSYDDFHTSSEDKITTSVQPCPTSPSKVVTSSVMTSDDADIEDDIGIDNVSCFTTVVSKISMKPSESEVMKQNGLVEDVKEDMSMTVSNSIRVDTQQNFTTAGKEVDIEEIVDDIGR